MTGARVPAPPDSESPAGRAGPPAATERRARLGARWDGRGVRFGVFSRNATAVELCLFDEPHGQETGRVPLRRGADGLWGAYLGGCGPGQLYGYRAEGPFAPEQGQRFNPAKLLMDPYARALRGRLRWHGALLGYPIERPEADLLPDPTDSAPFVPRCLVIDPAFDWGDDRPPRTPWERTVIYECHVKGLTALHPQVPEPHRGRFLGLSAEPVLDHLLTLGVTAVELLPVHAAVTEGLLHDRGLTNYWGYNTLGFFAPDARFASGDGGEQVTEFRAMVKALHAAGIEVILDVVYNHTAEGNHLGPTLSFRGLDNTGYYRLDPIRPRFDTDVTGCGNTLNFDHAAVLDLVVDSLSYWVEEMHVDGFRFDLAPALARDAHGFRPDAPFFSRLRGEPALAGVKLIAEPWDLGEGGYRTGQFPPGWGEWNDRFRDGVRRFWRGDPGTRAEFARRLAGSADLFGEARTPFASINFVACHDGLTLHDLVSFERKHNEANGEGNRDGTEENLSHNWGAEGPTSDPEILAVRELLKRTFLATLALSRGVPMLSQGDELGRTQGGNNNAYCHDGALSWTDWRLDRRREDLLAFTREVFRIRRERSALLAGAAPGLDPALPPAPQPVTWLRPDGAPMTPADWLDPKEGAVGMWIGAEPAAARGGTGGGEALLLVVNAAVGARYFRLPRGGRWTEILNTARPGPRDVTGAGIDLAASSLCLLERRRGR